MPNVIPVYLEQPGEHAEIRQRVGACRVSLEEGIAPLPMELKGQIKLDPEFAWLGDLLEGVDCSMGFSGGSGCLVLRPDTHIGGDRLA